MFRRPCLNAARTLAAGNNNSNQIGGLNTAGEFRGVATTEIEKVGTGIATSANFISNGTWDEDWSIAPNTGGFPAVTIVKLGILTYIIVEHLKQTAFLVSLIHKEIRL